MTTSKTKTFTMTSPFSNDFEKKWDNLLVFKNGLVDELCESNVIDYLNKPTGHASDAVPYSFSFASEVKKSVQRSKSFIAKIKYVKSTEEEESAFKFDFEKKYNIDSVNKESKIANNNLIIKVNPEFKSIATLENTDSLFISENFSSIDYSKTIFESSKFKAAYESLSDSYDNEKINKSEELKKYNNKSLERYYEDFYKNEKKSQTNFSNTIGFSIKALKVKDLFALSTLYTIKKNYKVFNENSNTGLDFRTKTFASNDDIKNFNEILKSLIYDFSINEITSRGLITEYKLIEINKIFSSNDDFFKEAFQKKYSTDITKTNDTLENLGYQNEFNDKVVQIIKDNFFRLEYFSLFDKTDNTFLTKNYLKNYTLNVVSNLAGTTSVSLNDAGENIIFDVRKLSVEQIKNKSSKLVKVFEGGIFDKEVNEYTYFNEKYQKSQKSKRKFKTYINIADYKLVDMIKSVEYSNNGYFFIEIEYIKITKFFNIFAFENKYLESYLFDPVICFETINGHTVLLQEDSGSSKKEDLTISQFVETSLIKTYLNAKKVDIDEKIGEKHNKFYKISAQRASQFLEILSNKNKIKLFLNSKYKKSFFYAMTSKDLKSYDVKVVKEFVKESKRYEYYYEDKFDDTGFVSLNSFYDKTIADRNISDLIQTNKSKEQSEKSKRSNDKKPNNKNRTKASSDAEKILKITGEVSEKESKTQNEKDNTKTKPESSRKSAKKLNELKKEVEDTRLITNWVELNQISDANMKGKKRIPQNKSVRITCGFNPYKTRRGNLQPKLLKLIENAFVLTSKKYSDLTGVEIYSTSSLPLDKWLKLVEIVNLKSHDKNSLVEALNKEGYKHINKDMSMTSIKKELSGLIKRIEGVRDSNHGMGFAADIRLKRGKNLVCLYSPHDDKDFEIAQFFIKTCFELGANSVGAGMYYMDEPKYKKYKRGVEGEPSVSKTLNYNGRVVVDDNFVPIRKKGQKFNGIHVDIVYNNKQFFHDFNPDGNNDTPKEKSKLRYAIGNNYKKIIKIFTDKFDQSFEKIEGKSKKLFNDEEIKDKDYVDFMNKVKQKNRKESSKLVWGSTSSSSSSDKWLLDAANINVSSQKSLSTEATELTKQKIEENKLEARQFIYKEFIKDKKKGTKHKDFKDIGADFDEHSLKTNGYDKYFVKLSTLLKESKKNK